MSPADPRRPEGARALPPTSRVPEPDAALLLGMIVALASIFFKAHAPLFAVGRGDLHGLGPRALLGEDDGAFDAGLLAGVHGVRLCECLPPRVCEDELPRAQGRGGVREEE